MTDNSFGKFFFLFTTQEKQDRSVKSCEDFSFFSFKFDPTSNCYYKRNNYNCMRLRFFFFLSLILIID